MNLTTDSALAGIVKPGWFVAEAVTVVDRDPRHGRAAARVAAAAMRARAESAETTAAVRTMYKRVGH